MASPSIARVTWAPAHCDWAAATEAVASSASAHSVTSGRRAPTVAPVSLLATAPAMMTKGQWPIDPIQTHCSLLRSFWRCNRDAISGQNSRGAAPRWTPHLTTRRRASFAGRPNLVSSLHPTTKEPGHMKELNIWMNGKLVPPAQAVLPVNTAAVFYATNVFEGLRAYWNAADDEVYSFRLPEHFQRFRESMKMMRFTI